MRSVPPPGEYATISVIGRSGYAAPPVPGSTSNAAANNHWNSFTGSFTSAHDAGGVDLDHRAGEHDAGRGHERERGRLGRIGKELAPHARERAIVAPRLGEVEPHVVAVRPVGLVRLELLGEDLHGEAR